MQEELLISGRNLPNIDPHLQVWHFPISLDLFLGGLAAGIIFFVSLFTILKKEEKSRAASGIGMIIAWSSIVLASCALFIDLTNKINVWRLYTTFRIESPMSWGAWVLLLTITLCTLWIIGSSNELFPSFKWKPWLQLSAFFKQHKRTMAFMLLPLSVMLGIYTGILLSAFNARPLWNNAILGPLFLASGLATGAACITLVSGNLSEKKLFGKIYLGLIVIELFLIVHMLMGMYAGSAVQLQALQPILDGQFTLAFFGFVILMGLLVPAILEGLKLLGARIPAFIPTVMVLLGGLAFRMVIVQAGQWTGYTF